MSATDNRIRGFTLIELLVTLAILAIAITLVPISFDRIAPGRQLDVQAQKLATELRDLRSLAMVSSSQRQARTRDGSLWLDDSKQTLPEHFSIESNTPKPLVFFPDGSTSGGVFVLTGPKGARRITVTMATGLVRVAAP